MGMEMRLNLKLSQQLVMTPQLQQAIKLLQLSRVELVELVREEMLENPVLEDDMELGSTSPTKEAVESQSTAADPPVAEASASDAAEGAESAAEGPQVNEIDWENYLDTYQSGPPSGGVRPGDDDLPSLEQTLTKSESLEDHLMWQLRMSHAAGRHRSGSGVHRRRG
jgi:RNA polymerase sigma-54 factor